MSTELAAPEERGSLRVDPVVARKVAQHVADHAPGTLRAPHGRTGRPGSIATVQATGTVVDIRLDVALCYPAPVREVTERLRRLVADEVLRVTGLQVRTVTFTVSALLPETRPRVE